MVPDKPEEDFRRSTIDEHDANRHSDSDNTKQRQRSHSTSSSASEISTTSSITSLFEASLALLGSLPVATSTSSSDKPIIHKSTYYGTFKLYLNSNADTYEEIQLQSHLLWPASPRLAEMMEEDEKQDGLSKIGIKGETVLELGAGSALLSLLAARMGASQVEITDYPATGIMAAIRRNVAANLKEEEQSRVAVTALDWTDEIALEEMVHKHPQGFTRILAADTLWMDHLNSSQLKVMTRLLSYSPDSRIIILAGLHTGRFVIQSFLKMALAGGLEIERAEEIDRREEREKGLNWKQIVEGDGDKAEIVEGIEEERRRWLVHIVFKRSDTFSVERRAS